MSTTGVPSTASMGPMSSRFFASSLTATRWSPNGLGRCGDRVANTPFKERRLSERGCTLSTLRRARCNQVMTMISSPTAMPSSARATDAFTSSQASGAPSAPCFGALESLVTVDRMMPIGLSRTVIGRASFASPCFYGSSGNRVGESRTRVREQDACRSWDTVSPAPAAVNGKACGPLRGH